MDSGTTSSGYITKIKGAKRHMLQYPQSKKHKFSLVNNCLCDLKEMKHQNPVISVGLCEEKFNIESNDHGRTH